MLKDTWKFSLEVTDYLAAGTLAPNFMSQLPPGIPKVSGLLYQPTSFHLSGSLCFSFFCVWKDSLTTQTSLASNSYLTSSAMVLD